MQHSNKQKVVTNIGLTAILKLKIIIYWNQW